MVSFFYSVAVDQEIINVDILFLKYQASTSPLELTKEAVESLTPSRQESFFIKYFSFLSQSREDNCETKSDPTHLLACLGY